MKRSWALQVIHAISAPSVYDVVPQQPKDAQQYVVCAARARQAPSMARLINTNSSTHPATSRTIPPLVVPLKNNH